LQRQGVKIELDSSQYRL